MTGQQARSIREALGLSQTKMAALLTDTLGRSVGRETYRTWEKDDRELPDDVSVFLTHLGGEPMPAGADAMLPPPAPGASSGPGDSAPGPGPSLPPAAPVLMGSGAYTRMCTELWELIATGVGMFGAATGNDRVMRDGQIIDADKEALGAAWGKLAETNEVFRKMLQASEQQGAYLAVALATGTTVGKIWRNHATPPPAPVVSADEALHEATG